MRNFKIILIVVLLSLPQAVRAAGWQWMAPQRTSALVKEGSGLWLVDVRNEAAFEEGHVEGAISIAAGLLGTKRLPKGKIIVLVDDSLGLRKGRDAAEVLLKNGHEKVYLLEGGLPAWQREGYPLAGQGSRNFRSVMPDDLVWAADNKIPISIFDLREQAEREQGPVAQSLAVTGKTLVERLEQVKAMLPGKDAKWLAAKLEQPTTIILVFPTAVEPKPIMERTFRMVAGDIRYLAGGYAAWAAKPDKNLSTVGVCPTCPKGAPGGKK